MHVKRINCASVVCLTKSVCFLDSSSSSSSSSFSASPLTVCVCVSLSLFSPPPPPFFFLGPIMLMSHVKHASLCLCNDQCFCYIFSTADHFTTKHSLMV